MESNTTPLPTTRTRAHAWMHSALLSMAAQVLRDSLKQVNTALEFRVDTVLQYANDDQLDSLLSGRLLTFVCDICVNECVCVCVSLCVRLCVYLCACV